MDILLTTTLAPPAVFFANEELANAKNFGTEEEPYLPGPQSITWTPVAFLADEELTNAKNFGIEEEPWLTGPQFIAWTPIVIVHDDAWVVPPVLTIVDDDSPQAALYQRITWTPVVFMDEGGERFGTPAIFIDLGLAIATTFTVGLEITRTSDTSLGIAQTLPYSLEI